MKKTAKELLEIIEANYSEISYAHGEWLETKEEIDIPDGLGEEEGKLRKKYYDEHLEDKYYSEMLEMPEYKVYENMPTKYDIQSLFVLNKLGLGPVKDIYQRGGTEQGIKWYQVWYFEDHDVYLRIDGYYTSYNGTDFYDGYGYGVWPTEKTITVYE